MADQFEPSIEQHTWDGNKRVETDVECSATIRFKTGPFDYQWIDVSLDGEGGIFIHSGNGVAIEPKASNDVIVRVPQWP